MKDIDRLGSINGVPHSKYIHTYIHWNPSVRITIYLPTPLMFKFDPERQNFFEKLFYGNFIYSQLFFQKSEEGKLLKKYLHIFVLMSYLVFEHYLLNYFTTRRLHRTLLTLNWPNIVSH